MRALIRHTGRLWASYIRYYIAAGSAPYWSVKYHDVDVYPKKEEIDGERGGGEFSADYLDIYLSSTFPKRVGYFSPYLGALIFVSIPKILSYYS